MLVLLLPKVWGLNFCFLLFKSLSPGQFKLDSPSMVALRIFGEFFDELLYTYP